MEKKIFGTMPSGEEIYSYTLKNADAKARIINYGATVVSFEAFGVDVVGGYDTLEDYLSDDSNQGSTVGRVANRIADAEFVMDGALYMLPDNDNGNCLHGGCGFNKRVWQVLEYSENSILLSYYSEDGEEGFPSGLATKVRFTLDGTALIIDYEAIPEGKTPIALTNHSYFNLDGFGATILGHTARIYAKSYTEVDGHLIPTGSRPSVVGTVFDFTEPHKIGERVDHNFILAPEIYESFGGEKIALGAEFDNGKIKLLFYTDQPGAQFYIGNFLGGKPDFKGGTKRIKHGGFCIEAQTEPNCIKHGEAIYDRGEIYRQRTVYKLGKI